MADFYLLIALATLTVGTIAFVGYRVYRDLTRPERIELERYGLVLGYPREVFCTDCGKPMRKGASYLRSGEIYTEWKCETCLR